MFGFGSARGSGNKCSRAVFVSDVLRICPDEFHSADVSRKTTGSGGYRGPFKGPIGERGMGGVEGKHNHGPKGDSMSKAIVNRIFRENE